MSRGDWMKIWILKFESQCLPHLCKIISSLNLGINYCRYGDWTHHTPKGRAVYVSQYTTSLWQFCETCIKMVHPPLSLFISMTTWTQWTCQYIMSCCSLSVLRGGCALCIWPGMLLASPLSTTFDTYKWHLCYIPSWTVGSECVLNIVTA